jgi:hypothetical protein
VPRVEWMSNHCTLATSRGPARESSAWPSPPLGLANLTLVRLNEGPAASARTYASLGTHEQTGSEIAFLGSHGRAPGSLRKYALFVGSGSASSRFQGADAWIAGFRRAASLPSIANAR